MHFPGPCPRCLQPIQPMRSWEDQLKDDIHTPPAAQSYMVLVVTKAVPPSSVAGSGILSSLTVVHRGGPLLLSVPACFVAALYGLMSSIHCNVLCASRWRWKGQSEGSSAPLCSTSVGLFLPDGSERITDCTSVFWRGSCPGFESSVMKAEARPMIQNISENSTILWLPKYCLSLIG